nr:uncharacterized protein LOC105863362 isoform X10 [Microcebus murinus]
MLKLREEEKEQTPQISKVDTWREHSRPTEHLQFVRDQRERIRTSAAFLPAQQGPPQMPRCSVPRCPTEQADWTHWLIQHKRARNLPTMLSPGYKANALLLKNMASQYSPSCHLYLMKRKSYSPWQGTTASDQQPVRTRGMAPARVWSWKQSLPSVEAQPAPRLQLCERLSQNKMPRHS